MEEQFEQEYPGDIEEISGVSLCLVCRGYGRQIVSETLTDRNNFIIQLGDVCYECDGDGFVILD